MEGQVVGVSGPGNELVPVRASLLPFEQLPNLPKAVIPHIDLGIERTGVDALALQPSLASQHRVGIFLSDRSTQTEQSDILEVKRVTHVIQTLIQDVAQLRKDLNFARHVLKADYDRKLAERATELYCRVNERLAELEKNHHEKVEIVRKSYRTQLANAIQKIAGEYKAYYSELLQGKTGRHDLKIKELRERIMHQEALTEQQAATIEELTVRLRKYEEEPQEEKEEIPPPPPPGISLEEAEELRATIDQLEGEIGELRAEAAAQEDNNKKLTRQVEGLSRQLEEERGRVGQLRRDLEALRRKTKADQERATKMAENQLAALQKEMAEKMELATKEASRKSQEQAELQRMRDQARFQEEMEQRRGIEEQLRSQQVQQKPLGEGGLVEQLERLQQVEQQQREEIERLSKELERTNRVWEMKLAIMQRNFHALKDEFFLRHNLQRQAAVLHHATVGYAVRGSSTSESPPRTWTKGLKPLPQIKPRSESSSIRTHTTGSLESDTPMSLPPPPSPLHSGRDTHSPSRSVHFEERQTSQFRTHSRIGFIPSQA